MKPSSHGPAGVGSPIDSDWNTANNDHSAEVTRHPARTAFTEVTLSDWHSPSIEQPGKALWSGGTMEITMSSPEFDDLEMTMRENVAVIELNRPEVLNAVRYQTLEELDAARSFAEAEPDINAILLRSANEDMFCVGGDLKSVERIIDDIDKVEDWNEQWHQTYGGIRNSTLPVIGAITGQALAGGLELVLICDIVVADEDASFGDQHINFNLVAGGGGSQLLPRIVGERRAKELILTGEQISAETALEWGLVNKVDSNATETAFELAQLVAGHHPEALRRNKTLVNKSQDMHLEDGFDYEIEVSTIHLMSDATKEGLAVFLNR